MSGELLLEVRAEEIPARMLPGAAKELATRLFEELMARGVPPGEIETGFTPRRLWLVMKRLSLKEPERFVPIIGPAASIAFDSTGQPTKAAEGFAKRLGVSTSQLRRKEFSAGIPDVDLLSQDDALLLELWDESFASPRPVKVKGEYVFVFARFEGQLTSVILAEQIPTILKSLSWAKTMRWGAGVGPWVRPVHGVVALLDGEVVPFEFLGAAAGRVTAGHPTLSPAPFEVASVAEWRSRLASLGIVPEPAERERRLRAEMESRAAAAGGTLVDDPDLLAKLAAICEIPGVMAGTLDAPLMALPREVLVTSLRDHQSALTVERDGRLLPLFLTVMDRADDPAGRVRAGNEWVVAARLADARFFWEKDRATPLADRLPALAGLGFHQKLGSYAAKRERLLELAGWLAERLALEPAEAEALALAASLAKSDLTTDMVREFTALQGVMGGIYAREEGQPEAVWTAIYDHYLPATTDDALPRGDAGKLLALADRIDNLVGFFGLGLVPTGSRDPFGLRRAAQAAVRLLFEFEARLDLAALVARSHASFGASLPKSADETWALLRPFLEDRLRFLFELEGFAYDETEAALKRQGETLAHLAPIRARIAALHAARGERDFLSVVLSAKRIANIVREQPAATLDPAGLAAPAELRLAALAGELDRETREADEAGEFARGLAAVARLAPALESFFDEVMVLDPDAAKRANRVALLQAISRSVGRLADLSELVVDKADYR